MLRFGAFLLAFPLLAQTPPTSLFEGIRNNTLTSVTPETVNTRDSRDTTVLMYAAAYGSLETLTMLLDSGANVNARNAFDSTALHWAAADARRASLLIARGANVNARTKLGRTPLMIAAACDGCSGIAKLMLSKGADAQAADNNGITALDLAARTGDTESLRLLLARGAQADSHNSSGMTALMGAAMNCNLPAIELLLAKGAGVQSANRFGGKVKFGDLQLTKLTALHFAAPYCSAGIIRALLDRGAAVNAADVRGMTPLMLAVASETQDAEVVRTLLQRGADVRGRSSAGETALDWANKFGNPEVLALLRAAEASAGVPFTEPQRPASRPLTPLKAIERATSLLQRSSVEFFKQSGCVGCHHQPAALTAIAAARAHGAKVDEVSAKDLLAMLSVEDASAQDRLLQRMDPGGLADRHGFSLLGMASAGHQPNGVTDTLAIHTALLQYADGSWHLGDASRAPLEEGDIARTARAMRTLQLYAPPARWSEFDARVARAAAWISRAKAVTNDDLAMQLAGLHWADYSRARLEPIARTLLDQQRQDGGWAQTRTLASDAFATGQTLWALREAGFLQPTDPAYKRGVEYLLRTQWPDGSWYVRSRAPKFQPYFQSGFPFEHDQWISASATAWAALALAPAIEKKERASK